MSVTARIPKIRTGDQPFVTRIGMAAVYQWDKLPPKVQELLLDQATLVEVLPMGVQMRQELEVFIRTNKVAD